MGAPAKRARAPKDPLVIDASFARIREDAMGGGIEGAQRNTRELINWVPPISSPDMQINPIKEMADARSVDIVQNDGLTTGAVHTHRDSIVGAQFSLVCEPLYELLGADEEWAEAFKVVVEGRFNLMAESEKCWFDASRTMTFTDMVRLAVGGFVPTGEVLATAEWIVDPKRPFKTAIQMVSPSRLSNPNWEGDSDTLRRGVVRDSFGKPSGYWIQTHHPGDFFAMQANVPAWKLIPSELSWGRVQVIHIVEKMRPDQTRGIGDMVSALKQHKMTKKFQDITLQNAVVNATYAAAIESELPAEMLYASMGAGGSGMASALGDYMTALTAYIGDGRNIAIDGVKMPHLFPGTKLNMKPAGTPGGIGQPFEESLLRHIAAPLGLSYEQFSKDYTKTNYSSARASMAETFKFMSSRKKVVAERFANSVFALWFEEQWNAGLIPVPKGKDKGLFYDPVMREALLACSWIGASRGQIDEMKETQAAILRIQAGLSTYQKEMAMLGEDFRKVFAQQAREKKIMEKLGLDFSQAGATKPGTNSNASSVDDTQPQDKPKKGAKA